MKRRLGFVLLLLAVTGVALFSRWLLETVEEEFAPPERARSPSPDYTLETFTATVMDASGRAAWRLQALELEHFPFEHELHLQTLSLDVFRPPAPPWRVSARRGRIHTRTRVIDLKGDVKVTHGGDGVPRVRLETPVLTIDPRRRTARTDAEVVITHPRGRVEAVGLRADMNTGVLKLLAEVRGVYRVR